MEAHRTPALGFVHPSQLFAANSTPQALPFSVQPQPIAGHGHQGKGAAEAGPGGGDSRVCLLAARHGTGTSAAPPCTAHPGGPPGPGAPSKVPPTGLSSLGWPPLQSHLSPSWDRAICDPSRQQVPDPGPLESHLVPRGPRLGGAVGGPCTVLLPPCPEGRSGRSLCAGFERS